MTERRDTLLEHYRAMRDDLLDAIAGLTEEQMVDPSLDGWSVKDHLAHLAFWDDLRSSEVLRVSAGHESAWRLDGRGEEALGPIVYETRRNLSLEQVLWEFERSHLRLLDAIILATPRAFEADHYGEAGLHSSHEAQHTTWIRRWRGERGH